MTKALTWKCRDRILDLTRPLVMGIVNATPDSFSDGGLHASRHEAIAWGEKLLSEGADILDIGGESTRPGAADVSVEEELERVVPVVESLVKIGAVVSVDTSKPEVMTESLKAGAQIINDIRAFALPGAIEAVKDSGAGLVIMHMLGAPRTMQTAPKYDDLLGEIEMFLRAREAVLLAAGVSLEQICWDAGFGFGKTVAHNFSILKATERFVDSGRPYLMGLSRKSSLGAVTGIEKASERITASVAGALIAVERGAQIVRVHDVRETCEALKVWQATVSAE
ncbi:MAG: dihydropteroate synthase [Sutterellaceae bacterium]|nr:dihydropteroate synthase [Sutterellaceae bacterium]